MDKNKTEFYKLCKVLYICCEYAGELTMLAEFWGVDYHLDVISLHAHIMSKLGEKVSWGIQWPQPVIEVVAVDDIASESQSSSAASS